jgi:transposase InsO family protein
VVERLGLAGPDLAVDLGTANTVVFRGGRGVVLFEPSVVAVDERTGAVLAVGEQARRMIGRTPATIQASRRATARSRRGSEAPGRPRSNRKAERLIQRLLNEWAYARIYGSSTERTAALPIYLDRYNQRRPHAGLNHQPPATSHQPPASRLSNVIGNYS